MPRFSYAAIDRRTGKDRSGVIDAATLASGVAELKAEGLLPVDVSETGRGAPEPATDADRVPLRSRRGRGWGRRGLRAPERALFTRQLAALVRAGLPVLGGLEVLARQRCGGPAGVLAADLAETIRAGGSLSDALARHPRSFDRLYLNLVRAGEAAGALGEVLERLAAFLEKSERTRRQIRGALTYPAFVLLVAVGIVAALTVFVVPRFRDVFASVLNGQSLPPLTEAVLAVADFGRVHGLWLAGATAGGCLLAAAIGRSSVGGRIFDRWRLGVPFAGAVESHASAARFARTLGTLLGSGVAVLEALAITRAALRNRVVADAVEAVGERVRVGEALSAAVEATGRFPPVLTSLMQVGEETGQLPQLLQRVADVCDEDVDRAVTAFTTLLEPLTIVGMAVVVGTVVLALFLPIIQIVQSLT